MPAQSAVWPGPERRRPRRAYSVMRRRGEARSGPGPGRAPLSLTLELQALLGFQSRRVKGSPSESPPLPGGERDG